MLSNCKEGSALILGVLLLSVTPIPSGANPMPLSSSQEGIEIYQHAQKELPKESYILYRVVERLARANKLDQNSWQVAITQKYDPNAFGSEVDLLPVYANVFQQLEGDSSAIACVVGREMAHHALHHRPLDATQQAGMVDQARQEARQEVKQANSPLSTHNLARSAGGGFLSNTFNRLSSSNGLLRDVGGGVLGGVLGNAFGGHASSEQNANDVFDKKNTQLAQQFAQMQKKQVLEADHTGYLYAVRAGFEPEGCTRAMNVMVQLPDQLPIPDRAEALQAFATEHPAQALAAEGKGRITATKPLTYQHSGESLRINSRNGGSSQSDLERLFGK